MKRLLLSFISIILIFAIVGCFLPRANFQAGFWSSLFAGLIVAIVFSILLDQFTDLTKKPKLKMVVKQGLGYGNTIKLSKREDSNFETSFSIAIKNTGNKTLKVGEGYWHIYFPSASEAKPDENSKRFMSTDLGHVRNVIDLPVFPNSFLDIGPEFKIVIPNEAVERFKVYYFFETSYGYFPKTVKVDSETGFVLYENMAEFSIEII